VELWRSSPEKEVRIVSLDKKKYNNRTMHRTRDNDFLPIWCLKLY